MILFINYVVIILIGVSVLSLQAAKTAHSKTSILDIFDEWCFSIVIICSKKLSSSFSITHVAAWIFISPFFHFIHLFIANTILYGWSMLFILYVQINFWWSPEFEWLGVMYLHEQWDVFKKLTLEEVQAHISFLYVIVVWLFRFMITDIHHIL